MLDRRHLIAGLGAAALALPGRPAAAQADTQGWPAKPLRLLVPYSPGGLTDAFARLVSGKLGQALGQPVAVDNRPGGNTIVATQLVVQAPPDGYTLLMAVAPLSVNHTIIDKLPYDYRKDLKPVIQLGDSFGLIAVHPSFAAKTLPELLAMAKEQPEKIAVAVPGASSSYRIVLEQLSEAANVKFHIIPYKGSAQAVTDAIGGHVPVTFDSLVALGPQISAGRLRALAVMSPQRPPDFPDVPTSVDLGFPDVVMRGYIGVSAPAGTPDAIVNRLNAEINKVLADPETIENARRGGLRLAGGTAQAFQQVMDRTTEIYGTIIKRAGIKPD